MKKYVSFIGCYIVNIVLHLLYIFPVNKKRIMFISYAGMQYSCNPRYISEYLQKEYPDMCEILWVFKKPTDFEYLKENGIRLCKFRSLMYYYYRLTSVIVVHNTFLGAEVPIRKKQLYIQTWHGSGAYKSNCATAHKSMEGQDSVYAKLIHKRICKIYHKTKIVCASCEVGKRETFEKLMEYKGEYVNGTPRIDMLINQNRPDLVAYVKRTLGIKENEKILLYAPTWRNDCQISDFGISYMAVKDALEQRFGGKWVLLRRMHRLSTCGVNEAPDGVIDATDYPDMQELLVAADAVISDYSSTLWDFSFTGKPCFQFCPDLDEYIRDRGISTNIHEWGFPLARTNNELVEKICDFDKEAFEYNMCRHHEMLGSLETGHATEDICRIIMNYMQE